MFYILYIKEKQYAIHSFLFNMQLKSEGVGASLAWRLENAHIIMNMFQNRCPFLYNSSAFLLSCFCKAQSHGLNFVLSWNFISRTIFTFFLTWQHLIIQKENGNGDETIYFAFNHIILKRKCFFTFAYFSPFDLKRLLNQNFSSLKAKAK